VLPEGITALARSNHSRLFGWARPYRSRASITRWSRSVIGSSLSGFARESGSVQTAIVTKNPWFWIAIAAPSFAIGFPVTKLLFDSGLNVWQINFIRFVIAALAVLAVFSGPRNPGHAWKAGMALGSINVATPSVFMAIGTDLLPASVAGILTAFVPLATALAAHFLVAGERFTVNRIPGALIAIGGVAVLIAGGDGAGGSIAPLGVAMVMLGVAGAAIGGALSRRMTMRHRAMPLVVPQYVGAMLGIGLVGAPLGAFDLGGLDTTQIGLILVLSIVGTALPFAAILQAFQYTTAARGALVAYIVPFLAAGMSILILGEPLTVTFAAGGLLVIVGVYIADRSERRIARATTPLQPVN
jgi:drug/metabolite transporter (DMT)-like permease